MIDKIKRMENFQFALLAFAILLIIFGSFLDYANQEGVEHENYCELVSMWEEDAELGIEPTKRDGHPNYKEINCEL